MGATKCKIFQSLFTISCVVVLAFMVGYWFYKYHQDEDVCSVDYQLFEETEDIELPVVSICFENPFLDKKLKEINPSLNSRDYLRYLNGTFYHEGLKTIDYDNVTLGLLDQHIGMYVTWKNGSYNEYNTQSNNTQNSPAVNKIGRIYETFNGFFEETFMKCFGLEVNSEYRHDVKYFTNYFQRNQIMDDWLGSYGKAFAIYHYPKQFLLSDYNFQTFNLHDNNSTDIVFVITNIEILRRRNKRKAHCMTEWKSFDDLVLKRHIESNGCHAPYHKLYQNLPLCDANENNKAPFYDVYVVPSKYYTTPCQSMSKIDVRYFKESADNMLNESRLAVHIGYPAQVKIITQSQAVDGHSLIGNIGGYIGLFLGMGD